MSYAQAYQPAYAYQAQEDVLFHVSCLSGRTHCNHCDQAKVNPQITSAIHALKGEVAPVKANPHYLHRFPERPNHIHKGCLIVGAGCGGRVTCSTCAKRVNELWMELKLAGMNMEQKQQFLPTLPQSLINHYVSSRGSVDASVYYADDSLVSSLWNRFVNYIDSWVADPLDRLTVQQIQAIDGNLIDRLPGRFLHLVTPSQIQQINPWDKNSLVPRLEEIAARGNIPKGLWSSWRNRRDSDPCKYPSIMDLMAQSR